MSWHFLQEQEEASWGGQLLGWRTVCAVEFDPFARSVLLARQRDGCLERFPIWDDVRTFDGHPWRGGVDVVSGGFPCQDISVSGKHAGITGERSGLWTHMARIVGEVRPRFVWVENSPLLVGRGLGTVVGDLSALGYASRWGIVGARHAGAPHHRDRIWILAHAEGKGLEGLRERSDKSGIRPRQGHTWPENGQDKSGWETEPQLGRVAHGVANWVDRLRCIGNGQVPSVVRLAWDTLSDQHKVKTNTGC